MLPELPAQGLVVLLVFAVVIATTMFVQLLGAIGAIEFMALTGGAEEGKGGEQQGKAFHCGVL